MIFIKGRGKLRYVLPGPILRAGSVGFGAPSFSRVRGETDLRMQPGSL